MGTLFLKGAAAVTAFSGYSFELLQKSQGKLLWRPRCEYRNA